MSIEARSAQERDPEAQLRGSHRSAAEVPDAAMIAKYNRPGPRYTSYPPAPYWSAQYQEEDYRHALAELGASVAAGPACSLYIHIPFCEKRCTFCACNVVISREHSRGRGYIQRLAQEMDLALAAMRDGAPDARPRITQMHWGGGTPTWLSADELDELAAMVADRFELLPDREQSIEIDPRVTTPRQLDVLRARGLTRVSMGVQDFDLRVQRAVNRVQSREQTESLIRHCRSIGIDGINVDLIYGLPHQTEESFAQTVEQVIEMDIDRLALYNFAWLPGTLNRHQAIKPETLPPAETRIEIFRAAAARFTAAGYVMIGLDHFAKRTDELTRAMHDGTLQRNFMGYTTRGSGGTSGAASLLSYGVSSISRVGRDFAQNVKVTADYQSLVESGRLPIQRGLRLSDDDLVREHIIAKLMCYGSVDFDAVERRFGVDLLAGDAVARLEEFIDDGLAVWRNRTLEVLPMGRYFLRNIAMVFDAYLGRPPAEAPGAPRQGKLVQVGFSRTV